MLSLRPNEINTNDVTQSWLTVPSQSIPTWGSIINFDVSSIGKINEIYVVFNMGQVTGISPVGLFPCMCSTLKTIIHISKPFKRTTHTRKQPRCCNSRYWAHIKNYINFVYFSDGSYIKINN